MDLGLGPEDLDPDPHKVSRREIRIDPRSAYVFCREVHWDRESLLLCAKCFSNLAVDLAGMQDPLGTYILASRNILDFLL